MEKSAKHLFIILFCGLAFSLLFFKSHPGINFFLYEVILVISSFIVYLKKGFVQNRIIGVTCLLLTSIALIFNAFGWTVFVNLLSFEVFVGTMMGSQMRSMFNAVRLSFITSFFANSGLFEIWQVKMLSKPNSHEDSSRIYIWESLS